jgi:hypothetical protein
MAERELTISALAGLEVDPLPVPLSKEEREKLVADIRDRTREIALLEPLDLGEQLLGKITEALREPLAGVLQAVWKQRKEMRDAAANTLGGHGSTSEVELFEHTIHWGVHPTVRVTVNKLTATLKFDAGIKLELKAAKIVIERAHITRFLAGTLKSTIQFKYKAFPLGTPVERTIDLPGQFELPHGGINLSGITDAQLPPGRVGSETVSR